MTLVSAFDDDALGDLDAVGVVEAYESGTVSRTEVIEAAIARTEKANPELNGSRGRRSSPASPRPKEPPGVASRWQGRSRPNGSSTPSTTMSVERFGACGCDSGNDDDYCCESSHLGVGRVVSVAEPNLDDEIRCLHDTSK